MNVGVTCHFEKGSVFEREHLFQVRSEYLQQFKRNGPKVQELINNDGITNADERVITILSIFQKMELKYNVYLK